MNDDYGKQLIKVKEREKKIEEKSSVSNWVDGFLSPFLNDCNCTRRINPDVVVISVWYA